MDPPNLLSFSSTMFKGITKANSKDPRPGDCYTGRRHVDDVLLVMTLIFRTGCKSYSALEDRGHPYPSATLLSHLCVSRIGETGEKSPLPGEARTVEAFQRLVPEARPAASDPRGPADTGSPAACRHRPGPETKA